MTDSSRDRIDGATDKVVGEAKEAVGKLTDDKQLEGEGMLDKLKGDVKEGVADVKDKVSDLFGKDKDGN